MGEGREAPPQEGQRGVMGVFSSAQPAYAERGIATFPLSDKKVPAVRNYQKIGLNASAKLADRFRTANGIGFMTNARSRISVLDVDTTDERVLADAMGRHGSTPAVVRTASGKFHALYRHNGEFRKIRPFGDLPIDLLGVGGLVVATPSRFEKGEYSFIQGSLDDIERLPVMRGLDPAMYRPRSSPPTLGEGASGRVDDAAACALAEPSMGAVAHEGTRNKELWSYCMRQLKITDADIDAIVAAARIRNASYMPPLPDEEVVKAASSAWGYTAQGRNWFGNGTVAVRHDEVDALMHEAPDAFLLLTKLRRHNWGKTFMVPNAMAATMPGGGWGRERFEAARRSLAAAGKIKLLKRAYTGSPALYGWA
jgi:Bifunctional DNA primase/polymerase, N-terminal